MHTHIYIDAFTYIHTHTHTCTLKTSSVSCPRNSMTHTSVVRRGGVASHSRILFEARRNRRPTAPDPQQRLLDGGRSRTTARRTKQRGTQRAEVSYDTEGFLWRMLQAVRDFLPHVCIFCRTFLSASLLVSAADYIGEAQATSDDEEIQRGRDDHRRPRSRDIKTS